MNTEAIDKLITDLDLKKGTELFGANVFERREARARAARSFALATSPTKCNPADPNHASSRGSW